MPKVAATSQGNLFLRHTSVLVEHPRHFEKTNSGLSNLNVTETDAAWKYKVNITKHVKIKIILTTTIVTK